MTRRDFEVVAAALARSRPGNGCKCEAHEGMRDAWLEARNALVLALEDAYPRFDVLRFRAATEAPVSHLTQQV